VRLVWLFKKKPGFYCSVFTSCEVLENNSCSCSCVKAYRWSSSIAPFIHNLGIRWRWMVSLTLLTVLPPRKIPGTREKEVGWAPQPIRDNLEKRKICCPPCFHCRGNEPCPGHNHGGRNVSVRTRPLLSYVAEWYEYIVLCCVPWERCNLRQNDALVDWEGRNCDQLQEICQILFLKVLGIIMTNPIQNRWSLSVKWNRVPFLNFGICLCCLSKSFVRNYATV
jgi:hypothetical protein